MRMPDIARFSLRGLAAGLVLASVSGVVVADTRSSGNALGDTYEWSAVLQSVDEAAGTAVLQARIEGSADIAGIDSWSDGDRLTLVWTGRLWASGIRDLGTDPQVDKYSLTLPVEFVSTTNDGSYLNFRIAVPEAHLSDIAAMESGTRVTGISPRTATDWTNSVRVLRHYNDID